MRVCKWCLNFYFWVNYHFNLVYCYYPTCCLVMSQKDLFFFFFRSAKYPLISKKKRIIVQMTIFLGPFFFQQCLSYSSVWLAGCWFWCWLMLHFERLWVMKREETISPCHVFAFSARVCKRACQRDWVEAAVINDVLIPSLVWSDSLWNGCLYV